MQCPTCVKLMVKKDCYFCGQVCGSRHRPKADGGPTPLVCLPVALLFFCIIPASLIPLLLPSFTMSRNVSRPPGPPTRPCTRQRKNVSSASQHPPWTACLSRLLICLLLAHLSTHNLHRFHLIALTHRSIDTQFFAQLNSEHGITTSNSTLTTSTSTAQPELFIQTSVALRVILFGTAFAPNAGCSHHSALSIHYVYPSTTPGNRCSGHRGCFCQGGCRQERHQLGKSV